MLIFFMKLKQFNRFCLFFLLLIFSSNITLAGVTSIDHLDVDTRITIQLACSGERMFGPKRYDQCIKSHLADIDNSYNSDNQNNNNSSYTNTTPNILGSSFVWENYIETVKDIRVSNLRIKVVKLKNNTCNARIRHVIEIEGMINDDTVFILEKLLQDAYRICPEVATTVTLNSGGGYINSGIEVGKLFRKYYVKTHLTKDQKCMSSCSTAFLGGYYRSMTDDSELMMHSPYLNTGYNSIKCASKKDVNNLLKYYQDMIGIDLGNLLFDRTMQYCDTNNGWTLNADAAEVFGILN